MAVEKLTCDPCRFYVYIVFRPNGIPCYIGKGAGNRYEHHLRRNGHNPHLAAIYRAASGLLPVVKIIENLSEAAAFGAEIALIAAIGREIIGGPLVNLTDGGEGPSGAVMSDATRAKMGASRRGTRRTQEQRLAQSARMKGTPPSAATRAAVSRAKRGIPQSPEARRKISQALRGKSKSIEHREALKVHAAERAAIYWGAAEARGEKLRWWSTSNGTPYRAADARTEEDHLGRGMSLHWWRTPEGSRYMASTPRGSNDIAGHGGRRPAALAASIKGTQWWHTLDGTHYRAVQRRDENDVPGRMWRHRPVS